MFDVPFLYGGGWDQAADDGAQTVVVLSKETNDKVFGGANSVGQTLRLDGRDFKVVGVLDDWAPTPKFYDLNNGAFDEPEELFVPFSIGAQLELQSAGNINCWRSQADRTPSRTSSTATACGSSSGSSCASRDKVEAFQSFIDNYVREQKTLGRFERPLNNHLRHPDEWLKINEVVQDDNRVLVGLSFMFLAVCLLNMIGLLLAKFLGAAPLVGLRRALGASSATIFRQHLVEVGVIGLGGGVLGIALAALGLLGVRQLVRELRRADAARLHDGADCARHRRSLSGVLAGLYPTWRVCRVQPAAHLKTQ